jgi:CRP-like cAMP-binding protein
VNAHHPDRKLFALPGGRMHNDAAWRDALRRHVETDLSTGEGFPSRSSTVLRTCVGLLRGASLFRECSLDDLEDLAVRAHPTHFETGEMLCVEGGDPVECFLITEGEASVTIGGRLVATVGEQRVIGERGPLESRPRTATVRAASPMSTYVIARDSLIELVRRNPDAARWMMSEIRRRYSD